MWGTHLTAGGAPRPGPRHVPRGEGSPPARGLRRRRRPQKRDALAGRGLKDAAGGNCGPPTGGLSSPGPCRRCLPPPPPPRARAGAAGWAPRHGGPERPELPPAARVGVRLPGPPVPQQPLLHGGQGDRVLRGGGRRGVQPAGAPAEVLPGPQRRHYQPCIAS